MNKLSLKYIQSLDINSSIDGKLFLSCVSDIFDNKDVQSLSKFIHHISVDRLQHVTSVAFLSYLLCRHLGLDYRAAARGAMLHDLFYYDRSGSKDKSVKFHTFRHPATAIKNARLLFDLSPLEESIIRYHMWPMTPVPPKSREGFIVCMADKYCAILEAYYSFFPSRLLKKQHCKTIDITP